MILGDLAHATGGSAVSDNDLAGWIRSPRQRRRSTSTIWASIPKDLKPDGKYHEIKVTLANSKGLSLAGTQGLLGAFHDEDDAATAATREIGEAVFSRDELRDLPIDIHTQFFKTTADDAKLKDHHSPRYTGSCICASRTNGIATT
jgi:hypothetical protein